jgi:Arc/MetJ family transcription regulator
METHRHEFWHHLMLQAMYERREMRTTLVLDDDLLAEAQRLTGMKEKTLLVREGLSALIERESARRLARLGGTEPGLTAIPRRRQPGT